MTIKWRCGRCNALNEGSALTDACKCGFVGGPLIIDEGNAARTAQYEIQGKPVGGAWYFDLSGPGMRNDQRWIGVSQESGIDLIHLLQAAYDAAKTEAVAAQEPSR